MFTPGENSAIRLRKVIGSLKAVIALILRLSKVPKLLKDGGEDRGRTGDVQLGKLDKPLISTT
jgi:hypothetical protein